MAVPLGSGDGRVEEPCLLFSVVAVGSSRRPCCLLNHGGGKPAPVPASPDGEMLAFNVGDEHDGVLQAFSFVDRGDGNGVGWSDCHVCGRLMALRGNVGWVG